MPWYDGLEQADIGHIQNRGYDKLEGDALAKSLYQWGRSAESKIGLPADRVLRLPEKPDDAAWGDVYTRLGKPATPDAYDLTTVKFSDGKELAPDFAANVKTLAHSLNLPADAGQKLASELVKQFEGHSKAASDAAAAAADKARTDKLAVEIQTKGANLAALQSKWGTEYDKNYTAAQGLAMQLGYTADELVEMAGTAKYAPLMERMAAMAKASGEAPIINPGSATGGGTGQTEEQLVARRAEIMASHRGKVLGGEESRKIFAELGELDRKITIARFSRRPGA
jgi:hypothetical protein